MERMVETRALMMRLKAWYVATLFGLWILKIIVMIVWNIDVSKGLFAAPMLSAMIPGDIYFRRTGQLPSNGFGWRVAIGCAVSGTFLTMLQLALALGLDNPRSLNLAGVVQFMLPLVFFQLVIIGPLKWFFGWGASSRQRVVRRKASRLSAP